MGDIFAFALVLHLWEGGRFLGGFAAMITDKLGFIARSMLIRRSTAEARGGDAGGTSRARWPLLTATLRPITATALGG
ncbi:hypothetical protein FE391_07025 [Nonomuraea sp. KC401]|uniref:hypothetical protein n=1 Tax=Nonomuraea sp. K271 TaxID=1848319 RepID=UPI0010FD8A10|nr:hypothetical protein [Nonomuraea sp. K271]TLF80672.1 hypothetical protein FE391_07025 [Nonomuraea sp. KC401]